MRAVAPSRRSPESRLENAVTDSRHREIEPLDDVDLFAGSTFDIWSYLQVLLGRRWMIGALALVFAVTRSNQAEVSADARLSSGA